MVEPDVFVGGLEPVSPMRVESLEFNYVQLANRLRVLENMADVWNTPWWKLALFILDGWPLRRVVEHPQWRPWRRWFRS